MANRLPGFILQDCTLAAGTAGNRIGQVSEITIPVLAKSFEAFRNAGMLKPREVVMGYEVTTASFKETAFDPGMIELFGLDRASSIIAYGYMRSEDGSEHSARFQMVAEVKTVDAGSWSSGGRAETSYEVTVHSGALFIDDEEIYAFDDFEVRVRGRNQMPGRRAALRMD